MRFIFIKFTLIIIVLVIAFGFSFAQAQTISSLNVSPAFVEDKLLPGEEFSSTITITNSSSEIKTVAVKIRDIQGFSQAGLPILPTAAEIENYEMANWLRVATDTVIIPAQSSIDLTVAINAPKDATLGRHLTGIFFSESNPDNIETGVIISTLVVGELEEKLEVTSFSTNEFIYSKPKILFRLNIENLGNSIIRPQGQITISNFFGKEIAKLTVNNQGKPIYPGNTESFTLDWAGSHLAWGRYQAVFSSVYGQGNQLLTAAVSFWILPLPAILGVFLSVVLLILALVLVMKKYIKEKAKEFYLNEVAKNKDRKYVADDVPDIIVDRNSNLKRLLRITLSLLVAILILLVAIYFLI